MDAAVKEEEIKIACHAPPYVKRVLFFIFLGIEKMIVESWSCRWVFRLSSKSGGNEAVDHQSILAPATFTA
jgi:hypothetical protein